MNFSTDRFWGFVCEFVTFCYVLFVLNVILLVLLLFSLVFLPGNIGRSDYVVGMLSLVFVSVNLIGLGSVIHVCSKTGEASVTRSGRTR